MSFRDGGGEQNETASYSLLVHALGSAGSGLGQEPGTLTRSVVGWGPHTWATFLLSAGALLSRNWITSGATDTGNSLTHCSTVVAPGHQPCQQISVLLKTALYLLGV